MENKIKVELEEVTTPQKNKPQAGFYWEDIYWGSDKEVAEYDAKKFEEFANNKDAVKDACVDKNKHLNHVITAEHFDIPLLEHLCEVTNAARTINKLEDKSLKQILTNKSILNYFAQPSSRTFLSFSMAEAHLGMRREEIRELNTSSFAKGESDKDALRTASSYFDAIEFRHPSKYFGLFAVFVMENSDRKIPVVSGGSGVGEHPTQANLDYYTKRQSFKGNLNGAIIINVGDCLRGRTVHSNARLDSLHDNITEVFVAPEYLQIDPETEEFIRNRGVTVIKESERSLRDVIASFNRPVIVYMTRIQDEHEKDGKIRPYPEKYKFKLDMLDLLPEGSILMHPLPKRGEIDPAIDYLHRHPKVMYWRQVRNGMWARVALLSYLFRKDQEILDQYNKLVEIHDKIERNK